ncbi:MAG: arylsulfatase, partial [Planctomycetota bacterium]
MKPTKSGVGKAGRWAAVGGILAASVVMCATPSKAQAPQAKPKPNIVLVFLDNFGWGEPGFNGGGIIRGAATPRLDKLASEG